MLKPGDRVIWLRSPGRSLVTGWKVQRIPGVVVKICQRRIRIKVRLRGRQRLVNIDPDNALGNEDSVRLGAASP